MKKSNLKQIENEIRRLTKIAMSGTEGIKAVANEINGFTIRKPGGKEQIMQGIADALAEKYHVRMLVISPLIRGMEPSLVPTPYFGPIAHGGQK